MAGNGRLHLIVTEDSDFLFTFCGERAEVATITLLDGAEITTALGHMPWLVTNLANDCMVGEPVTATIANALNGESLSLITGVVLDIRPVASVEEAMVESALIRA